MQALTLAGLVSLVVLLLPPALAFSIYVITLLFYPVYLGVQLEKQGTSKGIILRFRLK
jgi:hypothetical protein